MEPESGSNQTVWNVASKYCREAWGADTPYEGKFCISLTIAYTRHYLGRFGRLPPTGIFKDFAVRAVEIQKSYIASHSYSDIPNLFGIDTTQPPDRQSYWASSHKVSDFDN